MSNSLENKNINNSINDIRYTNNINFPTEFLQRMWKEFDWEEAKEKVFLWQQLLSKAAFKKDYEKIKKIQNKITSSLEARALAVRKVSELSESSPGIDGVKWKTDEDKMKATILLNSIEYKAKPLKRIIIRDKRGLKERRIGIPTINDRAMQVLHSFALEPVAEALADRKSFGFRKGRSTFDAHACLMNNLCDPECPEWILVTDIENYYGSVSHNWLLDNIPMNKKVLKELLSSGVCFNGEIFPTEVGISLGCTLSPILR